MSGSSNTKPTMGGNAMLGKIILDLPPSPGNPRNSEGAMLRLNDGSILFIYSAFAEATRRTTRRQTYTH